VPADDLTAATDPTTSTTPPPAHDAARRAFFFQFGRQAVTAVGQVAGMADIVGRTSSAVANELLGLDRPDTKQAAFARAGVTADPVVSAAAPRADDTFRSTYRLAGDELVILDQRGIPESLDEVTARRGSDVAYYLRLGLARGGGLMAQIAAYGLALTAVERADQPPASTRQELRRTGQTLAAARPSARLVAWAVERMDAAIATADADGGGETTGSQLATRLRQEADAIATDLTAWEAAIGARLGDALLGEGEGEGEGPLTLLVHGEHGALGAGQIGAGFAAIAGLKEAGREVRVFLTEGRPFMEGARLASWELRQAGIEHRVVADGAAAWLLEREPVDVVLLRAEWIAANGDTGALVGARALAQLAAAAAAPGGRGPRVVVTAPSAAIDAATPDGAAIPHELRPARELAAYLAHVPIRATDALVPAADVVPVGLIDSLVTEDGPRAPGMER
jgi:methylthioribose-1-phosphate isomerase